MQSQEQIIKICSEWFSKHAPAGLLNTEHNGATLAAFVEERAGGFYSIGNLTAAAKYLGDLATGGRLEYYRKPAPVPAPVAQPEPEPVKEPVKKGDVANRLAHLGEKIDTHRATREDMQAIEMKYADRRTAAQAATRVRERREAESMVDSYIVQGPGGRNNYSATQRSRAEMHSKLDNLQANSQDFLQSVKDMIRRAQ